MRQVLVGVPLPRDIAEVLEKAQGGLHTGRLVGRADMHVQLADLGPQPEEKTAAVAEALQKVEAGPFYLSLEGLGMRGGAAPDTLYAEADLPAGLKTLHKQVGRAVRLAEVELAHERYTPYVALARFGALGAHDLKQIMSFLSRRMSLSAGPFPVTDFQLYECDGTGQSTRASFALLG